MSIDIRKNLEAEISERAFRALEKTGDALLTEIRSAQVMPFNIGKMQGDQTYVQSEPANQSVRIVTNAPQAQRLYTHPEYNFQRGNNPNAGGEWLEPWISGREAGRPAEIFADMLKEEMDK